ncbi:MAG: CotH kinase family protein [Bacteroidota bacterium]
MQNRILTPNIYLLFALLLSQPLFVSGQIDLPAGSSFNYLKGADAATLDAGWINSGFDDSGWAIGNAPFRYGDGTGGTELTDMQNSYSTVYMRGSFTVSHADSLDALVLSIDYDDGFVIWINGERVLSQLAPGILSHDAFATDLHESGTPVTFTLDPSDVTLFEGENTLAIQGFNFNLESTDFLIDISLQANLLETVFPDTVGLVFSAPSGFYSSPFSLEITPADTNWNVVYTLDGSNPQVSGSALTAKGGATILIDPASVSSRDATPAVLVRASASMGGIKPSIPELRTFIFLDEVLGQAPPGGGWPSPGSGPNGQAIDLEMDSRVVNHTNYKDLMVPALKDIPSLSVVTDIDHLFDAGSGIYVNAGGHGFEWERECSAELILPGGPGGFNVNAGLRIRGGWSRHPEFAKHSFRLFFRSLYGDPKLYYPLFGNEGTDRYDKIDLRTAQNYAWSNGDSRNTFLRDVYSRDLQRDLGQPYTRSRYYHLYLNGMYWGLYQTQERSEARFAADYLGGNTDDYDVIKVNTEDWSYRIEATDGDLTLWNELWTMCSTGFASNQAYYHIEGKDSNGDPVTGEQVYVDIDNLIDYMLIIFYTGNFDSPTSSFGWNRGPNNFYAINSRVDRSRGFTFYAHDAEHSMFPYVASPGTGLYEDRVNLADNPEKPMIVNNFSAFHPQWLHHKLTENEEYRIRFMDRAHHYLTGDGVLTPEKNEARLNARVTEIEMAIIAESARWGDARRDGQAPFTKHSHWAPQVQQIRDNFFPARTNILIDQLMVAGLWSDLEAPELSREGNPLYDKTVTTDGPTTLLVKNPNATGTLFYTTDGSDPRMLGGSIAPSAYTVQESQIELTFPSSALLRTRIFYQGDWSPIREINLLAANEDYTNLVITEVHYHPEDMLFQGDSLFSKDLEFVEFKNTGEDAIALGGLVLDSAIYYEFPADAVVAPGRFYVVASKPSVFYLRYGMVASGNYKKNLSNGGEEVLLRDSEGNQVIHFIYSDDLPWPLEADGQGYSMVTRNVNPTGHPADPVYWQHSYNTGGSPFADDPSSLPDAIQPGPTTDLLKLYPNPTSDVLNIVLEGSEANEPATVTIYSINGNLVHQEIMHRSSSIGLSGMNLSSGIYMVRIETGNRVYNRKVVYR